MVTAEAVEPGDRIWTVPNALSFLRLLGVPVLLWLILAEHADRVAFVLLMASGISDYLDGQLARRLHQTSRLGALLDPLADRLYIASTVIALTVRGVVPVALLVVLALRDVVLAATLPALRRVGLKALPVSYLGKAATLNLLYAFPLLLLGGGGGHHGALETAVRPLGWAFVLWGTALYWTAAAVYLVQVRRLTSSRGPTRLEAAS